MSFLAESDFNPRLLRSGSPSDCRIFPCRPTFRRLCYLASIDFHEIWILECVFSLLCDSCPPRSLEAKTRLGQLLDRVVKVEEVIITRHDKPVARLIPEGRRNLESVRAAVAGLFELRAQIAKDNHGKAKLTPAEVRSWIEEGRR